MCSRALTCLFTLATAAGIVAGCSGGAAAIGDNTTDSGAAIEGGSPALPPGDAAATDAPSQPDTSTTSDAATDTRIDPIDVGRSWTYDVTILGTYPLCRAGSNTGRVLGQKTTAGKASFQVQSFCPGAGTSSYAVNGDTVEVYYNNAWVLSLDAPVAEGHTWSDGLFTYVWESAGSVTVPAGTFTDCWNARPQIGTSYTTFCRGIGPVRWHYVDGTGNGYDATLTAYVH